VALEYWSLAEGKKISAVRLKPGEPLQSTVLLDLDERAVEQLTTLASGWALSGLAEARARSHSEP
jgi:hypothetical protein